MPEIPESHEDLDAPEVMFLPLAVRPGHTWAGLDLDVLARRIPDFVHQIVNQGDSWPTGMLELQTSTNGGPASWLRLDAVPSHDEAFDLLPDEIDARAVVVGELWPTENGLQVELHVLRDDVDDLGADDAVTEKIGALLPMQNPVPVLLRLARHLARLLSLPFHEPPRGLLTQNGVAFGHFLQGLDNAMLLSGDLDIAVPDDREALMRPFVDALALDPAFGLALRVANATTTLALDGARIDQDAVRRFLDECYSAQPNDGDACVAIAEQLSDMGDEPRAFAWLEHATHLDPPPAKSLESLGILLVRRGDTRGAAELWQRGLEIDGHPDFFSHLAQVAFAEGRDDEAWELIRRGLGRLRERALRAGEWEEDAGSVSILLECLCAHLQERVAPPAVVDALTGLRGALRDDARVHAGLCLLAVGRPDDARRELIAGLDGALDHDVRDRAVRAMLRIDVPDFEQRFARAIEGARTASDPRRFAADLQYWLHLQDEFWPALYFLALMHRRLGDTERALDCLFSAADVHPGQPDVLAEMADLFAARGNHKRALELVERALVERAGDVGLVAARARQLLQLGRLDDARQVLQQAFASGLDGKELRQVGRALRRR